MINVGITGQSGFIGTHLYNYLGIYKDKIKRIEFKDGYFYDDKKLQEFVKKCEVIVHLAAVNRHSDPDVLYNTNIDLVKRLIKAAEITGRTPHIIFSSSIQEARDNLYGKSKRDGRILFESWAMKTGGGFTGLIIPNVFGPFCHPQYNSVIATFSYQLTHSETPVIEFDVALKVIYINDLIKTIYDIILGKIEHKLYYVQYNKEIKVNEILKLLNEYYEYYFVQNIIPVLKDNFEVSLFNTFRTYIDIEHYPVKLKKKTDGRGLLIEIIKEYTGGQSFFSLTKIGATRGNHFHTKKIERFCVLKGEGIIKMRKIGSEEIIKYYVNGYEPSIVDIPIWYTHNITNVGQEDMLTLFWTNEIFNPEDTDTFFEEV